MSECVYCGQDAGAYDEHEACATASMAQAVPHQPTVGHLFAGIDGFGLGLEQVGAVTAWTCELDPWCRALLALRVPGAEHHGDVRELRRPPYVDVLAGGFPCQDLSLMGRGAGLAGARSGLWSEYARVIGEVRPAVVLVENVPALLRRGMEVVVANLVELGYAVEWDCIPAAAVGAPHLRDRVWLVAHRQDAPCVFGQPAALFAMPPEGAAELVGGAEDEEESGEEPEPGWQRWPRAGWVAGDPGVVMPLQPLAPLAEVRRGRRLLPTPLTTDWADSGVGRISRSSLGEAIMRKGKHPELYLFPTPLGSQGSGGKVEGQVGGYRDSGSKRTVSLSTAVAHGAPPWPTPKASPSGPDFARVARERSGGDDLVTAVVRRDRDTGRMVGTALNPSWVEWLMGYPLGWTDPAVAREALAAVSWALEPEGVPRTNEVAHLRKQRLSALGNAVVPQVAAWLGARLLAAGLLGLPTEERS